MTRHFITPILIITEMMPAVIECPGRGKVKRTYGFNLLNISISLIASENDLFLMSSVI